MLAGTLALALAGLCVEDMRVLAELLALAVAGLGVQAPWVLAGIGAVAAAGVLVEHEGQLAANRAIALAGLEVGNEGMLAEQVGTRVVLFLAAARFLVPFESFRAFFLFAKTLALTGVRVEVLREVANGSSGPALMKLTSAFFEIEEGGWAAVVVTGVRHAETFAAGGVEFLEGRADVDLFLAARGFAHAVN